jgi:tetratricopeptide (TPR) repeat protein
MRRLPTVLLVLGFAITPLISVIPARADGGGSWVGKTVIVKKSGIKIGHTDEDGRDVTVATLDGVNYRVEAEQGAFIKVREKGKSGWFSKADAVLLEDAVAYFSDRIEKNEKDAQAFDHRAAAWKLKGELDIALKDYGEAIRLKPTTAANWNNRGNAWLAKKEYDNAIKDYDEAIRLDSKDARAFNGRGNAWAAKKEYDIAIKDYDEAIRLDSKDARAFNGRGIAWRNKKEYDKAIKDYDEAIRLDSKYTTAFKNRGSTWLAKKEYDNAIKDYDEAIRLDSKDARAFNNRGEVWRAKKEFVKAIADYSDAIRLDPKNWGAFNNRAFALVAKKDYTRAAADYAEARRLNPKNVEAEFGLAVVSFLQHKPDAAAAFRSVLNSHGWKNDFSAYSLLLGQSAARQAGDLAQAKGFLDDAGKLDDSWPLGVVRYLKSEIDEPKLLELAVDDGKRTEAHCYLGLDYVLKGNKEAALAHLRWVSEHGEPLYYEYFIAVAELERLERKGGEPKP